MNNLIKQRVDDLFGSLDTIDAITVDTTKKEPATVYSVGDLGNIAHYNLIVQKAKSKKPICLLQGILEEYDLEEQVVVTVPLSQDEVEWNNVFYNTINKTNIFTSDEVEAIRSTLKQKGYKIKNFRGVDYLFNNGIYFDPVDHSELGRRFPSLKGLSYKTVTPDLEVLTYEQYTLAPVIAAVEEYSTDPKDQEKFNYVLSVYFNRILGMEGVYGHIGNSELEQLLGTYEKVKRFHQIVQKHNLLVIAPSTYNKLNKHYYLPINYRFGSSLLNNGSTIIKFSDKKEVPIKYLSTYKAVYRLRAKKTENK